MCDWGCGTFSGACDWISVMLQYKRMSDFSLTDNY